MNLQLKNEKKIGLDVFAAIQGDLLEIIIKEAKEEPYRNVWKDILEGHSFKVTQSVFPKIWNLTEEIKSKLLFEDNVDFYITNNPTINASALSRLEDNQPHIINLNSGTIEKLDDDELRFVIGHEIGHLINNDARINRLLGLIYAEREMPNLLMHRFKYWERLAELAADRFGFIACPDLGKIISCFFTMTSGIKSRNVQINLQKFLEENQKILENYMNSESLQITSHPINPIRLKALQYFEDSEFYKKKLYLNEECKDEALVSKMEELYGILTQFSNSEIDKHMTDFIASAGLMLSSIDKSVSEKEIEMILTELSELTMFPKKILDTLYESKKITEVFENSVGELLKINPKYRYAMINFLINLSLADRNIFGNELGLIYDFGEKIGVQRVETSQIFIRFITERFNPDILTGL